MEQRISNQRHMLPEAKVINALTPTGKVVTTVHATSALTAAKRLREMKQSNK